MKKLLLTTLLALTSPLAAAGFYDGNELHEMLNSPDALHRARGMAYIAGSFDALDGLDRVAGGRSNNFTFCQPENMTLGQLNDIVRQFLHANPTKRSQEAYRLVLAALVTAFPCAAPAAQPTQPRPTH
jgi:hypothetical protein